MAERLAIEYDATEMDDVVVYAYQVRLWIAQGNLAAAARWVEERGLSKDVESGGVGALYHVREFKHITLARVYIAQGRPGEALRVDELFIAASTVRSHVKNIYGKLNVHRRTDAVQRAKELGLL
jgi:hypothetical protein